MKKIINQRNFLAVQLYSGHPDYFGSHPEFKGISELSADVTELSEIANMNKGEGIK